MSQPNNINSSTFSFKYTPAIQSRIEIVSGTCLLEAYVYIIMPRVIRVTAKCFNVECCRPRTNFSVMRDAVKDP